MFTPKDLQEIAFDKAMFGGYDMQMVDEFLEPLTEDYITLYKENAVLKSKLKILVERMEEYRKNEAVMQKALRSAQDSADAIVADAQRKASRILNDAESAAHDQAVAGAIAAEQQRMDEARALAQSYIGKVEAEIYRQLKALRGLKELTEPQAAAPVAAPVAEQEAKPAEIIDPELAAVIGSAVEEIVSAAPAQSAAPAEV